MRLELAGKALQSEFLAAVEEHSGQNVSACYQCGKCTGGCPVQPDLDLSPSRVLRFVQLGLEDKALSNETIWCCAACGTCTSRCPIGIDLVSIMDTLRAFAERKGISPPGKGDTVWTFFRSFLDGVRQFGRLSEVALMGSYNINSGRLYTNVIKAPWFVLRSKLGIMPHKIERIERLERVFQRIEEIEKK
ncbi:MAG: 4Fe-4S dicluster domain-containing protein [Planctomycetes bacterium]|nr:4Fe-4S dicluster domain-containing protein [Planctomycetota bacterium]